MRSRYHILLLLFIVSGVASAWSQNADFNKKAFNFGGTVGFTSQMPVIKSITVNEDRMENVRVHYKVGYNASIFGRVNFAKFFIQPSISWSRSESEVHFTIPEALSTNGALGGEIEDLGARTNTEVDIRIKSFDIPVLVGFHAIRKDDYGLSIMAGPKFKYNYKVKYFLLSDDYSHRFVSDNTPYGIGIVVGVGVNIWRLFLNFEYEFGLNQTESEFLEQNEYLPLPSNTINIDKRTNVLSFSLGILF